MSEAPRTGNEALPRRLQQVGDRFAAAWNAGRRPRIENLLLDLAEGERPLLLHQLLGVEIASRGRRGEKPTPQEYQQRFPQHAELIRAVFQEQARLGQGSDDI